MSKPYKTYTLAITASIGCGKSTVRRCLEELGVPVVDTDSIAHQLLNSPNPIYRAILERFGDDLADAPNGPINRKKLGAIVFADQSAREDLNALMHPAIRIVCQQRIQNLNSDIVAVEVPLLFESGQQDEYDEVWAVLAESSVRLKRLMARDSITVEQAQMRIDAQWAQEKKAALAHRIIDNSGTVEETRKQVITCLAKARAAAKDSADKRNADATSAEYREILRRFGYIGTDQALEQMGDLSTTERKEANASMTLVVDSANSNGGDHNRRELQVDVHMSVKQTVPPQPTPTPPEPPPTPPAPPIPPAPTPPAPTPPSPPPAKKKRDCWWMLGVLLAALIAFWVILPKPSVHDPGGSPSAPPIVQTEPRQPSYVPPSAPPTSESSSPSCPASTKVLSSPPDFIRQNLHNRELFNAAQWEVAYTAGNCGGAVVTGKDASGRVINIQTYGANLHFEYQLTIAYGAGTVQVDRFEPFNNFVGRTIYLFNNNILVDVQQLDGNQRLLTDARFLRISGQFAVSFKFYDAPSERLINSFTVASADVQSACNQRFYLFDTFGQLT